VALGQARTAREGRDVTIVTYGATVATALAAAEQMAGNGIEAEVVDLRTIQPWDEKAVLASLARTHRLVILHEAVEAFGVGAEIAARMADVGFDELDAPIVRVGAPFMPIPFAKPLEGAYRPDASKVIAAIGKVMA
jgi:acetoin:2,6-dichlorophenolindophenol oxidoreductase subunit beta